MDDPWHDYLALPLAPALLLVQVVALFVRLRWARLVLAFGCTAAIALMLVCIASLDVPASEESASGSRSSHSGFAVSVALLVVALLREGATSRWRSTRRSDRDTS